MKPFPDRLQAVRTLEASIRAEQGAIADYEVRAMAAPYGSQLRRTYLLIRNNEKEHIRRLERELTKLRR